MAVLVDGLFRYQGTGGLDENPCPTNRRDDVHGRTSVAGGQEARSEQPIWPHEARPISLPAKWSTNLSGTNSDAA